MTGSRLDWDRARRREHAGAPIEPRPSDEQLRYIADLAKGLGITLARPPETAREASLVIDGLKRRTRRERRRRR